MKRRRPSTSGGAAGAGGEVAGTNFGGILNCPVCWQLFQNYQDYDEDEQLRRSAHNPLRSPFARLLRREADARKEAQCSRVLCDYHKDSKRKYDLGLHKRKLEGSGRRLSQKELRQIARLSSSTSSDPRAFQRQVEAYVAFRFKRMLLEVSGSLAQDSESYKQQWFDELLDQKKKIEKQVGKLNEEWNVFLREERKEIAKRVSLRKRHFSASTLEFYAVEETLQKAQDWDALDRLQQLAASEERQQLLLFKNEQEKREEYRVAHLSAKVQTSFTAQRDRLYSKVKHIAVTNQERELQIEKRIAVVVQRLKIEQSREMSVIKQMFGEHTTRLEHFLANCGERAEVFQPFAALEGLGAEDLEDEGVEEGENGKKEKTAAEKRGPTSLHPKKTWMPFIASAEEKEREAPAFDPSAIFEFASKVLCEEMRILEHRKISMPDTVSVHRNTNVVDHPAQRSVESEGRGRRAPVAARAKSSVGRMIREKREGYDPILSAYNSTLMEELRHKRREDERAIFNQTKRQSLLASGKKWTKSKTGTTGGASTTGAAGDDPAPPPDPDSVSSFLAPMRPETKVVRNERGDLFSKSYTELFTKKDVYIAQPTPPATIFGSGKHPECAGCGKLLHGLTTSGECSDTSEVKVLRDIVNEAKGTTRVVVKCCSWACCRSWNARYSPPFLKTYREAYIEEREEGVGLDGLGLAAGGGPQAVGAVGLGRMVEEEEKAAGTGQSEVKPNKDGQDHAVDAEAVVVEKHDAVEGDEVDAAAPTEEADRPQEDDPDADEDAAAAAAQKERLPDSLTDRNGKTLKPMGPPGEGNQVVFAQDMMEGAAATGPAGDPEQEEKDAANNEQKPNEEEEKKEEVAADAGEGKASETMEQQP